MDRLVLIRKIAEEFSISEETASDYIKNIFDTILRALSSGKNVNIAEFGKFIIKNNKISFSPVKSFAQDINYNYAGLETIKIRNYNEKEFREKVNRLKKIEEEIEIHLGGTVPDAVEEYVYATEPPIPEKHETEIEEPLITDEIFIKEELPEKKEISIPGEFIKYDIIPENDIPKDEDITEEDVTEEDIEEAVNSAVEEFLKLNFPGREEEIPPVKTTPDKEIEKKEDTIIPDEVVKDTKESNILTTTDEKPLTDDFSDFIKQTKDKDITEEPVAPLEDINRFIIKPTGETRKESKETAKAEPFEPLEDINKFIIKLSGGKQEEKKDSEKIENIEEIIPDKTEEIKEQPREITDAMKNIEDNLAKKIEEANAYKNKVFNQDKLNELIEEREKIIRDIKLTSDYTIEPFRPGEPEVPEEPHQEIEKEDKKSRDFKPFIIPSSEMGQEEPVKKPYISDEKKESEQNIDEIIEEREKIIREIEKASGFTAETFMTKEPVKFPEENKSPEIESRGVESKEKKTEEFENFMIPPPENEPQNYIRTPEISETTEIPELTDEEIMEERRKFLEQEFKSPETTAFKSLNRETKSENEIDEYISHLDKIKDNLKTKEPGFNDFIIPELNVPAEDLPAPESELISGDVKELHDEIIKPIEEFIPDSSKNFDDVFIEDNKVIYYDTKETKASEEMYKKANLKSYDDVFFRFESDKKANKSETKKEKNYIVVGLIWFIIIAAILTILALIFG